MSAGRRYFPIDEGSTFLRDAASLKKAASIPIVENAIKISAPDFFSRFSKMSSQQLSAPLHNLISRMTFRAIPFGAFGGISYGTIDDSGPSEIRLSPRSKHSLVFLKSDSESTGRFAANPSITSHKNEMRFFAHKPASRGGYRAYDCELPSALIQRLKTRPDSIPEGPRESLLKINALLAIERTVSPSFSNESRRTVSGPAAVSRLADRKTDRRLPTFK